MIGQYVLVPLDAGCTPVGGIVRDVSADGRIVYVQVAGEVDLFRFSPDELLNRTNL